jgi:hypothetical protein
MFSKILLISTIVMDNCQLARIQEFLDFLDKKSVFLGVLNPFISEPRRVYMNERKSQILEPIRCNDGMRCNYCVIFETKNTLFECIG